MECANLIAPEHLEIHMAEPFEPLDKIKTPEVSFSAIIRQAIGDYFAGQIHSAHHGYRQICKSSFR